MVRISFLPFLFGWCLAERAFLFVAQVKKMSVQIVVRCNACYLSGAMVNTLESLSWELREYIVNALHHSVDILKNLVIPKPQYSVSLLRKPLVTNPVAFELPCVLSTVQLDDESFGHAYEIDDVSTQWLLTAKLVALQPATTQLDP